MSEGGFYIDQEPVNLFVRRIVSPLVTENSTCLELEFNSSCDQFFQYYPSLILTVA